MAKDKFDRGTALTIFKNDLVAIVVATVAR